MGVGAEQVHEKIRAFKKKYYLNLFVRGALLSVLILVSYFLIASLLEYTLWFGPWARFIILFAFFATAGVCIFKFLKEPLQWWLLKRGLNEEESARIIGQHLPHINDRLLNLIQLDVSADASALKYASVQQKSNEFAPFTFESFIDLRRNWKYLHLLLLPLLVIVVILIYNSNIITHSTERIFNFSRQYSPKAPFEFLIHENSLNAFYNEDFVVNVQLEGTALPEDAYIVTKNNRLKLQGAAAGMGKFTYVFENLPEGFDFQIEAAGFFSQQFHVNLINRPELSQFKVELEYPPYLKKINEKIINAGNLEIPEGTLVRWKLSASHADSVMILFSTNHSLKKFESSDNQLFTYKNIFVSDDTYEIKLSNDKSTNKEKISYAIRVVKDQYPQISVRNLQDSILYKRVLVGGNVSDDYAISELRLHFRIRNSKQKEINSGSTKISIIKGQAQQNFFYNWSIDSLKLNPGDQLEYYLQAWDNDGINGQKSTKTSYYTFLVPSKDKLVKDIQNSQDATEQKINRTEAKANELHEQIKEANQKLKGKKNLDWQDKKMLEDILEQKRSLDQMLEQLKEQNKQLEQKKDAFTEQDERIREKAKQIQKLMEEVLDEETKKLFEELQKLMKENSDTPQLQKLLDKLNQNTNNLEKELERALELFKQLQFDYKLDQTVENLKKQVEEQKQLLEETKELEKSSKKGEQHKEKENTNSESQELSEEQELLREEFEKTSEEIKDLKKLIEELQKPDNLPTEENVEQVKEKQKESKESLENNQPSKSKEAQQKSIKQMEEMQQQMEGAQSSMAMEMDMQNIESLRQILHGLVKLSFDQERLMKNLKDLNQSDPRFNNLAQEELKLRDDSKVLEDSLLSLGKRDPFMGSVVNKEIGELNNHIENVIDANSERKRPQAASEMQLVMTSINNLALMLDDHLDMMMQMMANAQPSMKQSKQKGQKPSLSQLQQQLNEKIKDLKGSGKSGRQLSEELAEMAAEQERIRQALQDMEEKMKQGGGSPGGNLPSKMEQSEMDLVNKQLTDQLIKRQQDILSRLLEAEKSAREQDMEEERKGESATDQQKEIPKAFEDYLRLREKEVELLKTVPPKLYPYYRKEVGDYFKRMGN